MEPGPAGGEGLGVTFQSTPSQCSISVLEWPSRSVTAPTTQTSSSERADIPSKPPKVRGALTVDTVDQDDPSQCWTMAARPWSPAAQALDVDRLDTANSPDAP